MNAVITTKTKEQNLAPNWKKEDSFFTSDEVINAYFEGKKAGVNDFHKILSQHFEKNLNRAMEVSENLLKKVKKNKIDLLSIHLKAENLSTFSILFIAKKEHYNEERFRDAYVLAREVKNEVTDDDFYIAFSFIPESEKFDEKCLVADGFGFTYEKK